MKKILIILILISGIASGLWGGKPYLRRFALIVGANDGGSGRIKLRYANSDAWSVSTVMTRLGGLKRNDVLLLRQPNIFDLLKSFMKMTDMVQAAKKDNGRVELVFYYSGHSDEKGLLLAGRRLPYPMLKKAIAQINADIKIAVLDSCSSGTLVRSKGGRIGAPFLHDTSMKMRGTVILTSSSHNEASQESDRIRGSFFTHYLVSGLRGGADMNRDGRVTLNELYQFAYHQTLAVTEKTMSGPQHPNYSIQLSGSGDVVLTDIRHSQARLVIGKHLSGTVSVRKKNGVFIAELRKAAGGQAVLGMEPGEYRVVVQKDKKYYRAAFRLRRGGRFILSGSSLAAFRGAAGNVKKGGSPAAGRPYVKPSVVFGLSRTDNGDFRGVSIGLWSANVRGNAEGVVLAPVVSRTGGDFFGFQATLGLCYNKGNFSGFQQGLLWGSVNGGHFSGFQESIVFVKNGGDFAGMQSAVFYSENGGAFSGLQTTVFVNWNGGFLSGIQAALYNRSGGLAGIQAGLFNISLKDMHGIQAGLINTAGPMQGVQAGLINDSHNMVGVQAGLINAAKDVVGVQAGVINGGTGFLTGVQAGLINSGTKAMHGLQAGLGNFSGNMYGLQAGLINGAADVYGLQAGLVNIGKKVSGVQVGLINIGEESDLSIGLINLIRKGQFAVQEWYDETGFVNTGLLTGGRLLFSTLMIGRHQTESLFTLGAGMGVGFSLSKRSTLRVDALVQFFFEDDNGTWKGVSRDGEVEVLQRYRISYELKFNSWLAVTGGFSLNVDSRSDGVISPEHVSGSVRTSGGKRIWPGFFIGINLL